MKKVLGFGLVIALSVSCSKDDDKPSSSVDTGLLLKKWYNVSATANGETEPYDDHETCGKDYLEFITGGIFKSVDVHDCDGNDPISTTYPGTYTTSGNKITVVSGGESDTVTIEKLTATELKVSYQDDWDGDGDEETVVETYTSTP